MPRSRRHRRTSGARPAGRSLLALAAILALLFNQALFSSTHVANATLAAEREHHRSATGDYQHAGDLAARPDTSKEPAASHHQTCHFCRLFGFTLPPPPAEPIGRIAVSVRLSWVALGRTVPAGARFRVGHPVRAPPRLA